MKNIEDGVEVELVPLVIDEAVTVWISIEYVLQ